MYDNRGMYVPQNLPPNLQRPDQRAHKIIGDYALTSHILGKGQFGEVVLAQLQDAKNKKKDALKKKEWMACKIIKQKTLNARLRQNLKSEIGILSKIQHPNVIGLRDIQKTANNFYLFMQYCNGGDLEELRELRGRFTEQEARYFLSQIIKGFQAINAMDVVHRDLKLANILIHFNFIEMERVLEGGLQLKQFKKEANLIGNVEVVIADLGFAKELQQGDLTETMCGTPLNMAPEILQGEKYDHKVDVWSLGTVFYEMLTGFTPFTGMNKGDLKNNLEKGNYMFPKQIKLSLEGLDFLNCCLQYNPHQRMSWDDLLKHSYLNYDHIQFMQPDKVVDDELLLSYNDKSGVYSVMMQNDPHHQLNEQNAILINTKNPLYFQQTYEKTLLKNFQNFEEEQNQKINQAQNDLGKSVLMQKMEEQDMNLLGDFKDALNEVQEPAQPLNPDILPFQPAKEEFEDQQDSRPFLADQIIPQAQKIKKKKKLNIVGGNEDQDKGGNQPVSDVEKKNSKNSDYKQYGAHVIDYNKINNLGKEIEHARSQVNEEHSIQSAVVNIDGNVGLKANRVGGDFEQINHSEARENDKEFLKLMEDVEDVGKDSYYPLVTNDPAKKKEFIWKINDAKLGDVFDSQNENKFNLQSIIIEDNHFAKK